LYSLLAGNIPVAAIGTTWTPVDAVDGGHQSPKNTSMLYSDGNRRLDLGIKIFK
jgi:hypothetical protein